MEQYCNISTKKLDGTEDRVIIQTRINNGESFKLMLTNEIRIEALMYEPGQSCKLSWFEKTT